MVLRFVAAALCAAVILFCVGRKDATEPALGIAELDAAWPDRAAWGNSGHLSTTLDPYGRIHLVWVQYRKANHSWLLQYARQTDDLTGWTPPVAINEPGTSAYTPEVAFNENGEAAFIWVQPARGSNLVFSREMSHSGALGPVVQVDRDRGDQSHRYYSGAYDPHISYDRAKRAWHAIWSQWDGWADRIFVNERAEGTPAWGGSSIVDAGRTDAYAPTMCFNARGQALAVWYQLDWRRGHTAARPFIAARPLDKGWQPAADVSGDAGDGSWTRIMCDGDRGYYVVWHQSDAVNGYRLWGTYVAADGTLAGDRILLEARGFRRTIVSGAEMARGADGKALVVWCGESGGRQMLYSANWDGPGRESPLVDAMPLSAGTCLHPAVAAAPDGRKAIAWTQEDDTSVQIRHIGLSAEPQSLLRRLVAGLGVFGPAHAGQGPRAETMIKLAKDVGEMHPTDKPVPPRFTKHVKLKAMTDGHGRMWAFWVGLNTASRHSLFAARIGG